MAHVRTVCNSKAKTPYNPANMLHAPPKKIADQKVVAIEDYLTRLRQSNNGIEKIKLPQSDVIKFYLENENTITIRPSGTEPKCKFYYGVKSLVSKEKAVKTANEYHLSMLRIIDK